MHCCRVSLPELRRAIRQSKKTKANQNEPLKDKQKSRNKKDRLAIHQARKDIFHTTGTRTRAQIKGKLKPKHNNSAALKALIEVRDAGSIDGDVVEGKVFLR